ncbi:hypothetical protein ONS95_012080 [Cadophora gregata]|uniref:uncharacterized protein n=1 Tax=Cadophora gregata TaxID=51156 RepID=UPI0026DA84BC|nr:uncharacterized protein ONS95_012080 [Cadophora gregata]KAK0117754.1 hypothetical protein ONS95_012080 [Cadophora gregata]KAK0122803.1 hypothetical protein ONS96_009837 [Cadophora gregata f. sp. sojae]
MNLTATIKHLILLTLAVFFIVSSSVIAATAEDFNVVKGELLPQGFEYAPLRMTGSIGDIALKHTGTIEEILAKVAAENPGFKAEDILTAAGADVETLDMLDKRTKSDFYCWPFDGQPTWRPAVNKYISEGIAYLKRVQGLCWVDGHKCSRISCSWGSAISLCNVTPVTKGLSCGYMASYAQEIKDRCTIRERKQPDRCGGQFWDTEGYNINVFNDKC